MVVLLYTSFYKIKIYYILYKLFNFPIDSGIGPLKLLSSKYLFYFISLKKKNKKKLKTINKS